MVFKTLSFVLLCTLVSTQTATPSSSPWAWACRPGRGCVKVGKPSNPVPFATIEDGDDLTNPSLAGCKLTCNPESSLWPKPTEINHLSRTIVAFQPEDLSVADISGPIDEVNALAKEAIDILKDVIQRGIPSNAKKTPVERQEGDPLRSKVIINVAIVDPSTRLETFTDESYVLHVITKPSAVSDDGVTNATAVTVTASTFFGARHGLETLSQLIAWDDTIGQLIILQDATITDSPAFAHRGILFDTARNYVSVPVIKKVIDGMAYNKLNVFHWHITDTHSFPFVSKSEPRLSLYGAYSPSQVYTPEDIEDLVHYAKVRGVKVVPEFDAPAHVGSGWEWGERDGLGQMALCYNKEPWSKYCVEPPCGVLNPVNDNVYKVLNNIYKDMSELFQSDIFHMGGDEVSFVCWNETAEILDWLKSEGKGDRSKDDFLYLWSHFQNRSLAELDKVYGKEQPIVLWTSGLTEEGHTDRFLDKNRYIIQIWTTATDKSIAELYQQGFRLIMSNYDAWYLDCGYGPWVGNGPNNWCSPYIGWQKVYENSPRKIINNFNLEYSRKQVLGGEAAIWTEQVDGSAIEGRLWPRCAALGERLWSDPDTDWRAAEDRMNYHRQRMVQRGIAADGLQPEWCVQHDGYCFL